MNWKILSLAVLIVLTLTILAYDFNFYSIPSRIYMSSSRWTPPFPSEYITLSNISYSERTQIVNYLRAGVIIHGNYFDVSDEYSPIRDWVESMFNTYRGYQNRYDTARLNVKLDEDEYYAVYLWQRKTYDPPVLAYVFNAILNILTVSLWIAYVRSASRKENET